LALNNTDGEEKHKILRVLGAKEINNDELNEAVQSICSSGIDFHIRNIAKSHVEKALSTIECYPNSAPKRALQSAADFVVERSL
jgi:geranylgeranyl pyrophosphate synthase